MSVRRTQSETFLVTEEEKNKTFIIIVTIEDQGYRNENNEMCKGKWNRKISRSLTEA